LQVKTTWNKSGAEQGADFRPEEEQLGRRVVIERFYTQPVACEKKPFLPRIPHRKCKHPGETLETRLAPVSIGFEEHLGIAMGAKPMSEFLKFAAEDLEVVDFSVEDNPIPRGGIFHRHVPGRG